MLPLMPVHTVVLAKAPVAGRVKTRLVPALGAAGATELAGRLLADAVARVHAACGQPLHLPSGATLTLSAELCGSPAPGHADWIGHVPAHIAHADAAPGSVWTWTDQGGGDLGERMARASQRVTQSGRAVLLVGTDCPTLSPDWLREAALRLQRHQAVLLGARDGGYVLLGLRSHCPAVFEHMPWSTDAVASLTLQRLQAQGLDVWQGPLFDDVDTPADLARLQQPV
jgi:hypothetical protein